MATVKWLLVGAGDVARQRVAAALHDAERSQLMGVCDVREEHAASLGKEYGASEVFTDLETALRKTAADAVYVATPVWLHAPQAVAALQAGKHVLAEKPLGLTSQEAHEGVAAAEASGKRAGVASADICTHARCSHAERSDRSCWFG